MSRTLTYVVATLLVAAPSRELVAQCQTHKILGSRSIAGSQIGWAIDLDGNHLVVGAPNDHTVAYFAGMAYVFAWDDATETWTEQAQLFASDAETFESFGGSTAIDDDTIVVGSRSADKAYVFRWDPVFETWTEEAVLRGDWTWTLEVASVDVDEDRIVVGMVPSSGEPGVANIYRRDNVSGTWHEEAALTSGRARDDFGGAVAVHQDVVAVGTRTSEDVRVYRYTDATWTLQETIAAPDGEHGDEFGRRLDLDGNTLVIGSRYDDDRARDAGAVYIYTWNGAAWTLGTKLFAPDAGLREQFGFPVAIQDDRLIVGARKNGDRGRTSGSAYVFHRVENTWIEHTMLLAEDGAEGDEFGADVAIDGDRIVSGAWGHDAAGSDAGAVYMFDLDCAPPLALHIGGACPGTVQANISGATSNASVAVLVARRAGSVIIPDGFTCAGTQLGLDATVQVLTIHPTDRHGYAMLSRDAPVSACDAAVQVLDIRTCRTSNVIDE